MMENQEVKKTRKKVKRRSQSLKLILVCNVFLRKVAFDFNVLSCE